MKFRRSKLILTSLVTLLPLFAGLLLWNRLPESIATHFGSDNIANGWSSKPFTVFALPCFLLAVHLICVFATLHDPKKANISSKLLTPLFWMIPVISCVTYLVIYGNALGAAVNPGLVIHLLLGVIFLILGNYMTKAHQNYTVGIKLPWTLNSTENWNRTHRLASKCFLLGGLAFFINAFLCSVTLTVVVVVLCTLIPTLYSFFLYKKGI